MIPQILRIIFVRFPKALPFCFLEITKSLTLLLINLAVLMFHARHATCKAFYVFQIWSVSPAQCTHITLTPECAPCHLSVLQVALLAHISPEPSHQSETLHTIQLASRIHRMRRKKMRVGGSSGGGSGSGGSSDENKRLGRLQDSGEEMDGGHNEMLDLDLAWVQ